MNYTLRRNLTRICFFVIGLCILSLGIAMTIKSTLGIGSWDAVNMGLSLHLPLTYGTCMNIAAISEILLGAIISRSRPKISCMLTSIVMGLSIDLWLYLLTYVPNNTLLLKISIFLCGAVVLSFGNAIYLTSKLPPSPLDCYMLSIKDTFNLSLRKAKIICESSGLILAFLLGAGSSIGLGTLFLVFCIGPIIEFFYKHSTNVFEKIVAATEVNI